MQNWTEVFSNEFNDVFANKGLGQNFLFNPQILAEIASPANIESGNNILEIGPGLGTLTAQILSEGASVTCVEFDENLAENLIRNISKIMKIRKENGLDFDDNFHEKITIINADFLQFDLDNFAKNLIEKKYKIVANIPYNITKPIITKIIESENPPDIATILVQREVADKVAAADKENSVLSLRVQNFAKAETGINVSRSFFKPEPKVQSKVLILTPQKISKIREFYNINFSDDNVISIEIFAKKVWRLINTGFLNKRKKIRTSLVPAFGKSKDDTVEFLIANEIDPDLRAQNLMFDDWLELAKKLCESD